MFELGTALGSGSALSILQFEWAKAEPRAQPDHWHGRISGGAQPPPHTRRQAVFRNVYRLLNQS
jgi:hypothetical protein